MPKNECDKALNREIALNALHADISDAMALLKKIQKEFTGVSEALWPLVFTVVLGEVRSIRHVQDNPWPSLGQPFEAKPEKLETPDE